MKKIELHVHLDGSVRPTTVSELSKISLMDVKEQMIVDKNTTNLTEYIKKFDLPIKVMQSKTNLTRIAYELAEDLKRDDVIYAEVRFSPLFHTKEGLTYDEIIMAILDGFKKCLHIKINLILCMMRGFSYDDNLQIIYLAKKYLGKGVCGLDLAGDEYNYKTSQYKELFDIARQNNIPFTIHAGEADGASSIKDAISFGAKRIGHGVRCIEDEAIMKLLKDKQILLEICPTSNCQTKAVESYIDHPIKKIIDSGIKVCVNTDNRTVSNISLTDEYTLLKNKLDLTESTLRELNINAIEGSFLSQEEKEVLKENFIKAGN